MDSGGSGGGGGGGGAKANDGGAASAASAESAAARDVAAVARRGARDNLSLALKWLDIFVPKAKLNIAFCLLGNAFRAEAAAARRQRDAELAAALARSGGGRGGASGHGDDDNDHAGMKISVSVEALGSGQVLVPDITLSRRATLLELKKRIAAYAASKQDPKKKEKGGGGSAAAAASVGTMRLFRGHGGPELKVDTHTLLMGAVADGAVIVLAMAMDDVTALTALFYVTGGTSWNRSNRKHWRNPNKHHSRWSGVLCPPRQHVDHDRVLRLTLSNAGLNGPIPAVIGQLNQLTHLCMRGNRLTGAIPTEIGLLTNLEGRSWDIALDLAENQLSGPVPTEIGKLTKLRAWDLRGNVSLQGDGGLGKKFS